MFDIPMELKSLEESIVAYEQEPIIKGKIMFYGHSLFTRWGSGKWAERVRPMTQDICMKDGSLAVVNHGFGTSTTEERLYYYDRMVRPWEPRALVLATMGNDVGFGYSARDVMEIEARIIQWAQADFPGIPIYCFSRTPRPSWKRESATNRAKRLRLEHNAFLEDFCARTENCHYVAQQNMPMFFENPEDVGDYNKVRDDIFAEDGVHLNPKGYGLFMDAMRELLSDLL